ncbi:MAG: dienelactone hydrolase family protein [Devosia sp.]|uniref:alpha/beta hydrolase n=1 Tax=Devosia sp. TaxID=1871048 RepID=UPI001A4B1A80|nr:dienelactone hydrolase family protein [Devosia sp.]MBL8597388.1 dienelactone hydrolase family protein [Devosia sp.]
MTQTLSGPMMPPKAGGAPKRLMVLLHGYGADGQDLISLGYQWRELWPDMLFVAPNAPDVCDMSATGYQWFPIGGEMPLRRIQGVEAARPVIVNFLIDLWAQTGISPGSTVLAGFSQGAMMALHVGTSLDQGLAGIVAFSGAFVPPAGFGSGKFARPPTALVHGDSDGVVAPDLSREAAELLAADGFDVRLHISPGVAHGIAPDGLEFATAFLVENMAPTA